jgi:hypothetical protein
MLAHILSLFHASLFHRSTGVCHLIARLELSWKSQNLKTGLPVAKSTVASLPPPRLGDEQHM